MRVCMYRCLPVLVLALVVVTGGLARAQSAADQLAELAAHLDAAVAQMDAGDLASAQDEFAAFESGWFDIEDGIRLQSRARYRAIEDAISDARFSLQAEPLDADSARVALERLRAEADAFVSEAPSAAPAPATAPPPAPVADANPTLARTSFSVEQVQQAMKLEQLHGHVDASVRDLGASGVDLARAHAEHALQEEFAALEPAIVARDAGLAQRLKQALTNNLKLLERPSLPEVTAAASATDDVLDDVAEALFPPSLASDLGFRASVVSGLVDLAADEYAEAVSGGKVKLEEEYQNAYAYIQRGRLLWRAIKDQVRATAPNDYAALKQQFAQLGTTIPMLAAPAQPVSADQVAAIARQLGQRLAAATGASTATPTVSPAAAADQLKALSPFLDTAIDSLNAADIPGAKRASQQFQAGWLSIEDAVRARSRETYLSIERAIGDLSTALDKPDQPDPAAASAALKKLDETIDTAIPTLH